MTTYSLLYATLTPFLRKPIAVNIYELEAEKSAVNYNVANRRFDSMFAEMKLKISKFK